MTIAHNLQLPCEVELNSTLQANRQSMSGTDYGLALNIQICFNSVPGRAGGYVSSI